MSRDEVGPMTGAMSIMLERVDVQPGPDDGRVPRPCKLCGKLIVRLDTAGARRQPFDATPILGGPWKVVDGRIAYAPEYPGDPDSYGFTNHRATCTEWKG